MTSTQPSGRPDAAASASASFLSSRLLFGRGAPKVDGAVASLPKPAASKAPAVEFMAVPTDGEAVYDAQRATWTEKRLAGIRKKMKEEAEEKKK